IRKSDADQNDVTQFQLLRGSEKHAIERAVDNRPLESVSTLHNRGFEINIYSRRRSFLFVVLFGHILRTEILSSSERNPKPAGYGAAAASVLRLVCRFLLLSYVYPARLTEITVNVTDFIFRVFTSEKVAVPSAPVVDV